VLDATYRPPAQRGDVYQAVRSGAGCIGIVDGYLETAPAVLHKEILFALSAGAAVFGCSSMGALRAAELADFGMIGVGAVCEAYRAGEIEGDDEVAVSHGPAELGYPMISEALVNIRATLRRAVAEGVLAADAAAAAVAAAQGAFYKERSYALVLGAVAVVARGRDADRFARWLETGKVDQKRCDAMAMLEAIRRHVEADAPNPVARFHFQRSRAWRDLEREFCGAGAG
jgi:hypothetical protein